jgi:hypothetical protein
VDTPSPKQVVHYRRSQEEIARAAPHCRQHDDMDTLLDLEILVEGDSRRLRWTPVNLVLCRHIQRGPVITRLGHPSFSKSSVSSSISRATFFGLCFLLQHLSSLQLCLLQLYPLVVCGSGEHCLATPPPVTKLTAPPSLSPHSTTSSMFSPIKAPDSSEI